MIATIVDTQALLETIGSPRSSPGVGATVIVSLAILGSVRFAEASRDGPHRRRRRCSARSR